MAPVRMKDIAKDLGVSTVTVSKALRNHPDIGEETRERVLQRAKELRYRPNVLARGLVTGRTYLIAIIIPDLVHTFFVEICSAFSDIIRESGYTMLIAWTAEVPSVQNSEVQHLVSLGIDAAVVAASGDDLSCFEILRARNVPFVLLDRDLPALKASFVGVDDLLLGKLATQHLLDTGCKRIAHIAWTATMPGRLRLRGYEQALKAAERPLLDKYVQHPDVDGLPDFQMGFATAQRLLQVKPRPDGIFCFNDALALGAVEAVLAQGLRIPEDVSILGAGNHAFSAALRLPLTTMDQNTTGLGTQLGKLVLAALRADPAHRPRRRVVLKPTLIVRSTTKSAGKI